MKRTVSSELLESIEMSSAAGEADVILPPVIVNNCSELEAMEKFQENLDKVSRD